jgi:hypothetical protein
VIGVMVDKLIRVALREAFPSEVKDLSRWVQSNLEELNAATGLSLTNASVEQPAGDFSVDLVAEDDTGAKVIIENQIGRSDHDHLGKVLTYLTAHEAQTAVWIVEKPRSEHVQAIAWLNQSSSADFYLVKVEAFKIGNSDVAPLLTLIVGPSPEDKNIAEEKETFQARHNERLQFQLFVPSAVGMELAYPPNAETYGAHLVHYRLSGVRRVEALSSFSKSCSAKCQNSSSRPPGFPSFSHN